LIRTAGGALRRTTASRQAGVRWGRWFMALALHLLATALAVIMVFPLLWMLSTSLKLPAEQFIFPPKLLPSQWQWDNYVRAWEAARFSRYFLNSAGVSITGTLLTLGVCAMAAYAFSKLEFKGREALFWLVLSSQMIPGIVTLIPSFLVVRAIPFAGGNDWTGSGGHGWLNSFAGLIVPGVGSAFGVFLLRQFFQSVPNDLLDAARVDGSSEFGIFARIVMPLAKPALMALAIFTFQGYWNDFLWPLVVTTDDSYRTVQLGLTVFRQRFTTSWGPLMAGVTIATVPMVIVFLAGQRYFVSGIALTGLKG
jgi:multiple sugar transport system permease protein